MYSETTLYSIGHGHKTREEFITELKCFNIKYLIDVRTNPYSKWAPHFNQGTIETWLMQDIIYIYMGDSLGGKPQNELCYDIDGFFDYKKMAQDPLFQKGLNRLVIANNKKICAAIMCTETDPSQCHRTKLIGRELFFSHNINMYHIIDMNKYITQVSIMTMLTNGEWTPNGNLFEICEPPYFKSCKSYKDKNQYIEDGYI